MQIQDPSFDTPQSAQDIFDRHLSDPALRHGIPEIQRQRPCGDCAVTGGLYTDIALSCWKYLAADQCQSIAATWICHNGGRCEGAAKILLSSGGTGEAANEAASNKLLRS